MPYYAVANGDVFKCILADDPVRAAFYSVAQYVRDNDGECRVGPFFLVAEHNAPDDENITVPSAVIEELILSEGDSDSI